MPFVNLVRATVCHANLSYADLEEARLEDADFYAANLSGASFVQANLNGARLFRADLDPALVDSRQDLEGARFEEAPKGVRFTGQGRGERMTDDESRPPHPP